MLNDGARLVHEAAVGVDVAGAAGVAPPPPAIAIEARFSSPTSKLHTTAEDIISKERLFREQLDGGALSALGIPDNRVTYVIMVEQATSDEKAAFFARRVVVLDRACVARALAPTLVDRAHGFLQPRCCETS